MLRFLRYDVLSSVFCVFIPSARSIGSMRAFSVGSGLGTCTRPARVPVSHAQAKESTPHGPGRRGALASLIALTAAQHPALADTELTTLYGLASPPTSYGGYGGNVKEAPKYKFDYPDTWKQLTVNKVQKVCCSEGI